MYKYFRTVAGKSFACDEKGVLLKNDEGALQEVEDTSTLEEVEGEEDGAVAEVSKMLKEATDRAKKDAEKSFSESAKAAADAVNDMFQTITEAAKKNVTKITEATKGKSNIDVDAIKKGLNELATRQRNTFSFEIKDLNDLNYLAKATSESGSLTGDVIEGQRVPEITRDPVRQPFLEQIVDVTSNMTNDHLSYVEVVDETGAPAVTAELAEIPEKDFEFQEFKAYLKKIAVMNKHSVEILQDAAQLVAAIKGWLQEDINIAVDQQILTGDGVGDNLPGIFGKASVLDATAVGSKRVSNANLSDVIRVAITKVYVSGKGKFVPTYVLLNPEDADALDLTKDENGQYVLPPFRSADGTTIKGARVIENVGVPEGQFLVGDLSKYHVGTKGGVEIEMTNSDGTDFAKDILSVKLRRRITAYMRANDNGAFWTGSIADVIEALSAAPAEDGGDDDGGDDDGGENGNDE